MADGNDDIIIPEEERELRPVRRIPGSTNISIRGQGLMGDEPGEESTSIPIRPPRDMSPEASGEEPGRSQSMIDVIKPPPRNAPKSSASVMHGLVMDKERRAETARKRESDSKGDETKQPKQKK